MLKVLKRNRFADFKRTGMYRKRLNSIAATREFIFGAIAEIVDNSSDADAKNLHIYTNKIDEALGGWSLNFLDDGCGMDSVEATSLISFGPSAKLDKTNKISQFGNGFMTGSTRIGNDSIVFTKKNSIGTIIFISQSFLDGEDIASFKIPLPSFRLEQKGEPFFACKESVTDIERETHSLELEMIYKYSPYKCLDELLARFDLITGKNGTLVTIYNLSLNKNGNTELDIYSDPTDILVSDFEVKFTPESQPPHKSLREYLSILYLEPRMKMFIQGIQVAVQRLDKDLFKATSYQFSSGELNLDYRAHEVMIKAVSNRAIQPVNYRQKKMGPVEMAKFSQGIESVTCDQKSKYLSEHKTCTFTFGVKLFNKYADGIFIYNSNRLITMFAQTKQQQTDEGLRGIVGVVEVSNAILKPAFNKQAFQDSFAARLLDEKIGEQLECYGRSMQLIDNTLKQSLPSQKRVLSMCDSVNSERLKKPRLDEEGNESISPNISTDSLDVSARASSVSNSMRRGQQSLSGSSSSFFMDISNVSSISPHTKKPKQIVTIKSLNFGSKPPKRSAKTLKQTSSPVVSEAKCTDISAFKMSLEAKKPKTRTSKPKRHMSKNY